METIGLEHWPRIKKASFPTLCAPPPAPSATVSAGPGPLLADGSTAQPAEPPPAPVSWTGASLVTLIDEFGSKKAKSLMARSGMKDPDDRKRFGRALDTLRNGLHPLLPLARQPSSSSVASATAAVAAAAAAEAKS